MTQVNVGASLGSDHTGLWLTHHLLQAINHSPPNWLPPYTIQDASKEVWITNFRMNTHMPDLTHDPGAIKTESTHLTSLIEEMSVAVFGQQKDFSPRNAQWWNEDCREAVTRVHNATTNKTKKAAQKSLHTAVCSAKKEWANGLLHNAITESLWKATRW